MIAGGLAGWLATGLAGDFREMVKPPAFCHTCHTCHCHTTTLGFESHQQKQDFCKIMFNNSEINISFGDSTKGVAGVALCILLINLYRII